VSEIGTFPFGQPIRKVKQRDRTPQKVFVLGVYASAVHAKWIGPDGKQLINAVGVASEPEIFWTGEGADQIVGAIEIPEGAGKLVAAPKNLNGPSGRALDEHFLKPLGLSRDDAWLCDLVPYSCMNDGQADALERSYKPAAQNMGLPSFRWDPLPKVLVSEERRTQIGDEISEARPEILITLGDLPLKWHFGFYGSMDSLGSYGKTQEAYGRLHPIEINGHKLKLLPLVHPRQAAKLGGHSADWTVLHGAWSEDIASSLI
jgi:uracil-DNA glycosylase